MFTKNIIFPLLFLSFTQAYAFNSDVIHITDVVTIGGSRIKARLILKIGNYENKRRTCIIKKKKDIGSFIFDEYRDAFEMTGGGLTKDFGLGYNCVQEEYLTSKKHYLIEYEVNNNGYSYSSAYPDSSYLYMDE